MKITLYLGLDVHKDSITIAIAVGGRNGEVRLYGTISNDLNALEKALRKIRRAHGGAGLEVGYEAGPCGFGIARRLAQLKVACQVVAPSMTPTRSRRGEWGVSLRISAFCGGALQACAGGCACSNWCALVRA